MKTDEHSNAALGQGRSTASSAPETPGLSSSFWNRDLWTRRGSPSGPWLWAVWGLTLAGWTLALLTPHPARVSAATLPLELRFPVAKTLHVSVYAFLTALAAWLPVRRRWPLLLLLSLHGCATEFLQQFVPLRHGCLQDVGWDHLGLVLGLALTWKAWRQQDGERG